MEGIGSFPFGVETSSVPQKNTQSFFNRETLVVITTLVLAILTAIVAFSTLPLGPALLVTIIATIGEYVIVDGCIFPSSTATKVHLVGEKAFTVKVTRGVDPIPPMQQTIYSQYPTRPRAFYDHQAPFPGNPTTPGSNYTRSFGAAAPRAAGNMPPPFAGNPTTPGSNYTRSFGAVTPRAAGNMPPPFAGNPTGVPPRATGTTPPQFPGDPTRWRDHL